MVIDDFKEKIKPFFWIQHDNSVSICLNVGYYKNEIFQTRAEEGFEGSGYDWASLAEVFLEELKPDLIGIVNFDPEASMFCAYSNDRDALKEFAIAFKNACENKMHILNLFSRAELD